MSELIYREIGTLANCGVKVYTTTDGQDYWYVSFDGYDPPILGKEDAKQLAKMLSELVE